jgi:hypothetical protein
MSICDTVPSAALATHKERSSPATASGRAPTGTSATTRLLSGVDHRDGVGQRGDALTRCAQRDGDDDGRSGQRSARGDDREAAATAWRRVGAGACARRVERAILGEDRLLELAQLPPRLEPQLIDQRAPCVAEALQRVRLAAGPVERQHVLCAQAPAERVLAHEPLQLRHQLDVTTETEIGLDALLDRREA